MILLLIMDFAIIFCWWAIYSHPKCPWSIVVITIWCVLMLIYNLLMFRYYRRTRDRKDKI